MCERLDINRQNLYKAKELEDFKTSGELLEMKIEEIQRTVENSNFGNEHRSLKKHLQTQEVCKNDIRYECSVYEKKNNNNNSMTIVSFTDVPMGIVTSLRLGCHGIETPTIIYLQVEEPV